MKCRKQLLYGIMAIVGIFGLTLAAIDVNNLWQYFTYFTHVGNIYFVIVLTALALGKSAKKETALATGYMMIIGFFYIFLMADKLTNEPLHSIILHYVQPTAAVIIFSIHRTEIKFDRKYLIPYYTLLIMYYIYVGIIGGVKDFWPYHLFSTENPGWGEAFATAAIATAFSIAVFIGLILIWNAFLKHVEEE